MSESILVFSGKSLKDIKEDNGIGWWVISEERAKNLEFAVITRCLTQEWATHDVEQGTAILICQLTGELGNNCNRKCLKFSYYAKINIPKVWQNITNSQRNPIKYIDTNELLEKLNININELEWIKFTEFKI